MEDKIYFDNNATSIIDKEALHAMFKAASRSFNPSSLHSSGRKAREMLEQARAKIAKSVGIELYNGNYDVLFVSSGTEANNFVVNNFKILLISAIEHYSIIRPAEKAKELYFIPVDQNGKIDTESYVEILKKIDGKKLVSIMFANNETGVLQDIEKLVKIAHEYGAIFHCDAVQAFGKIDLDLNQLDSDLITISSHKCGGPTGVAALIYKKKLSLEPIISGGGQERRLRSGTENIPAIVGFSVIAENIKAKIESFTRIRALRDLLEEEIFKITNGAMFYSKDVPRLPNTSMIKMPQVNNLLQLIKFDLNNIEISVGAACSSGKVEASHVLLAMGVSKEDADCTIRVSLGESSTKEEVERFVKVWSKIYQEGLMK